MRIRPQWIAVLLIMVGLLSGCELWYAVFSVTDEEAETAVSLVLNVFADTYPTVTSETVAFDRDFGVLTYATGDGSFVCEFHRHQNWMTQTFDRYQPQFSEYVITGELSVAGGGMPDVHAQTTGTLEMTGGPVTTLEFRTTTVGNADDVVAAGGPPSEEIYEVNDADAVNGPVFFGDVTANGRGFGDQFWSLGWLAVSNFAIIADIYDHWNQ